MDQATAAKVSTAGARNPTGICRQGESLFVGTALSAHHPGRRGESILGTEPPVHHPPGAPGTLLAKRQAIMEKWSRRQLREAVVRHDAASFHSGDGVLNHDPGAADQPVDRLFTGPQFSALRLLLGLERTDAGRFVALQTRVLERQRVRRELPPPRQPRSPAQQAWLPKPGALCGAEPPSGPTKGWT